MNQENTFDEYDISKFWLWAATGSDEGIINHAVEA